MPFTLVLVAPAIGGELGTKVNWSGECGAPRCERPHLYVPMTPGQGINQALPDLNAVRPEQSDTVAVTATGLDGSTNESRWWSST